MRALAPLPLLALLLAAPARAGEAPPERLLFAGTQVYLRWDGVAAHRAEYGQVAIGKLLQGDFAPLTRTLLEQYPRLLQTELTQRKLLDGVPPAKLARLHADVAEAGKLLDVIAEHGVVIGLEVGNLPSLWQMALGSVQSAMGKKSDQNPFLPRVLVTLVLPNAAGQASPVFSALRLLATESGEGVEEQTVGTRKVQVTTSAGVHISAWVEGLHGVVVVGTEPPKAVLTRLDGAEPRLDANPLYRRVQSFDQFRTDARGFVDARSLIDLARRALSLFDAKTAGKLEALGLDGLQSAVFYSGFDGPVRRELLEVEAPGPRKGLTRLAGGRPLAWDRLPPLPPDASRWSAHRLDLTAVYDLALQLFDLAHPPDPDADGPPETLSERLDKAAGVNVRADVMECLGDQVVTYHSQSEGAIAFGQVLAVEVKDAEKLLFALDQIAQTLAGGAVRVKRRPFRDGEIREFHVRKQGFVFVPSYMVYKGWLVMSFYPQPLQGFVQRASGQAKAWEPDEGVKAAFAALPRNALGLAVSDYRPAVQQALSFAPLIIASIQSFSQEGNFEVGTLPSASVVNQYLTPNATVLSDDGKTLRWESRGAVLLPFDSLGVDPVMLILSAQILF
jgi:hypothetical protein